MKLAVVLLETESNGGLQIRWSCEDQELVRLEDQPRQRRRSGRITDLPAGKRKALSGRPDPNRSLTYPWHGHERCVFPAVEGHVLKELVTDGDSIMPLHQIGNRCQFSPRSDQSEGSASPVSKLRRHAE